MLTFYRLLSSIDPDARNAVLTVVEGPDFGDKCLLSAGELLWERDRGGFFARNADAARGVDRVGIHAIGGQQVFCELPGREKQLVICGGGHVAVSVVRVAKLVGLPVTVLEDRPAFADNARAAGADRVICAPFEAGLAQIPGSADTFFVIVSRSHASDVCCLNAVSRKPHAYIGMLGSRRRVPLVREKLVDQLGCDPAVIDAVHMPIGLAIGAETPEEIAVAIMAEIIQIRRSGGRSDAWPRALLDAILDPAQSTPKALATVVARRGSAPRGEGARMLVWADGHTLGTVGGGALEYEVTQTARTRLQAGQTEPCLRRVSVDGGAAAVEGMACGGEVTVLIETIPGQ